MLENCLFDQDKVMKACFSWEKYNFPICRKWYPRKNLFVLFFFALLYKYTKFNKEVLKKEKHNKEEPVFVTREENYNHNSLVMS